MILFNKPYIFLTLTVLLSAILRFSWLGNIPPSLYSDEASQGYNAYSILSTGKDEYGTFLPVSIRSFGDWKPPLGTYLIIPAIFFLGLSEVSIRFPSAVLGLGTVILIFFLTREFFKEQKYNFKIALLSSFFLGISPWHILQSRAAMLVAVGLFFLLLGVYSFLLSAKNSKYIFLSSFFFALSFYSYYGLRLVSPLTVLLLLLLYRKRISLFKKELFLSGLAGIVLLLPLFFAYLKEPDVVFGRAKTVSIFYDQGITLRRWELITQDGVNAIPLVTRFFHNNVYLYGRSITQRLLSHFDGRFLILTGDESQPFKIPGMGIIYFPDWILIFISLVLIFKQKYNLRWFILLWLLVSILPAAFTFVTPSSNRTFNAVSIFTPLVSVSIFFILGGKDFTRNVKVAVISLLYVLSFGYFLNKYFIDLPKDYANYWNYGWREVTQYLQDKGSAYANIFVPDYHGMPYVYVALYQKKPLVNFHEKAVRSYVPDRFGFEHVEAYGNYFFPNEFDWDFTKKYNLQKNSLYVIPTAYSKNDSDFVKAIYYPDGKIAFKIFAYD